MKNTWQGGRLVTVAQKELDLCEDMMRALVKVREWGGKLGVDTSAVVPIQEDLGSRHPVIAKKRWRELGMPAMDRVMENGRWAWREPHLIAVPVFAPAVADVDKVYCRRYEKRAWVFYELHPAIRPVLHLKLWDRSLRERAWKWIYDGPLTLEQARDWSPT